MYLKKKIKSNNHFIVFRTLFSKVSPHGQIHTPTHTGVGSLRGNISELMERKIDRKNNLVTFLLVIIIKLYLSKRAQKDGKKRNKNGEEIFI